MNETRFWPKGWWPKGWWHPGWWPYATISRPVPCGMVHPYWQRERTNRYEQREGVNHYGRC